MIQYGFKGWDMKKIFSAITLLLLLLTAASCTKEHTTETAIVANKTVSAGENEYPHEPIKIIVAYKEGGRTDIGARILCKVAQKYSTVPLVIKNISGADGELGYTMLLKAKPDGYTIGFINIPTFLALPMKWETMYDCEDIEPIANLVYDPSVLVVLRSKEIDSYEDFIEEAKNNPYMLMVGNNGYGASDHIAAASLAQKAGIEITHIPYVVSTDMLVALRNGQVDALISKASEVSNEEDLACLCVFTDERLDCLPAVPTLKEKGIDFTFGSARALVAPKGTDKEAIQYLSDLFQKAMEDEEMQKLARENGMNLQYLDAMQLKEYIEEWKHYITNVVPSLPL